MVDQAERQKGLGHGKLMWKIKKEWLGRCDLLYDVSRHHSISKATKWMKEF